MQSHSRRGAASYGVLEPGTTTLRLLVVEAVGGQATVLGWAEGPGWVCSGADLAQLVAACGETLSSAEKMALATGERLILPDQIVVGLPASQVRGRACSIVQHRSRPERLVDERELQELLERALRLAVNRLLGESTEQASWLLVDAAPVALAVDGRGVTDPVGFRGREIGATVFAALAQASVIETWGLVARELEFSALTLTAAPLALAAVIPAPQGILLDIGRVTTDLIWCQAGRPLIIDSVPLGGELLTRTLMEKWRLSSDRAERLKGVYSAGELDAEARSQVQQVLLPGLQAWFEATEASLVQLNQEEPLPQHLYLSGGGSALPEMSDAVRALAWSQRLRFARYPQVQRLQPTEVAGVVNRTGLGHGMGDVSALALAAWAARQEQPRDRPSSILGQLCQQ
jgi:cell division ATPase FtsA